MSTTTITDERPSKPIVATDRYSALIRHGTFAGHDAGPDDYDAALTDVAEVYAWAIKKGLDRVANVAQGMMTAILVIDPRDPISH